jgi:hypothetical protein
MSLIMHFKAIKSYIKPYPLYFDYMKAPDGWKVPDFYRFGLPVVPLKATESYTKPYPSYFDYMKPLIIF